MRALTDVMRAIAASDSQEPVALVEIDWDDETTGRYAMRQDGLGVNFVLNGVEYLPWVVSITDVSRGFNSFRSIATINDLTLSLSLDCLPLLETINPLGREVRIYLWFRGCAETDRFLIFSGVINSPSSYGDETRQIDFDCVEKSTRKNTTFGVKIKSIDFPTCEVPAASIGQVIPIYYGAITGGKCKAVQIDEKIDNETGIAHIKYILTLGDATKNIRNVENQAGANYDYTAYGYEPGTTDPKLFTASIGDLIYTYGEWAAPLNGGLGSGVDPVITFDLDGIKDDASGTYTGTPSAVITKPTHVIRHFLCWCLGWSTDEIDADTFAETQNFLDALKKHDKTGLDMRFQGGISTERNAADVLSEMAAQCFSRLCHDGERWKLQILSNSANAVTSISSDDMIAGTFNVNIIDFESLLNRVTANYLENHSLQKFDKIITTQDSASISSIGERNLNMDCWLIGDDDIAEAVRDYMFYLYSQRRRAYAFDASLKAVVLDPIDKLTFSHSIREIRNRKACVEGLMFQFGKSGQSPRVRVECRELAPDDELFLVGKVDFENQDMEQWGAGLDANVVALYDFEEAYGATLADESGNGNDLAYAESNVFDDDGFFGHPGRHDGELGVYFHRNGLADFEEITVPNGDCADWKNWKTIALRPTSDYLAHEHDELRKWYRQPAIGDPIAENYSAVNETQWPPPYPHEVYVWNGFFDGSYSYLGRRTLFGWPTYRGPDAIKSVSARVCYRQEGGEVGYIKVILDADYAVALPYHSSWGEGSVELSRDPVSGDDWSKTGLNQRHFGIECSATDYKVGDFFINPPGVPCYVTQYGLEVEYGTPDNWSCDDDTAWDRMVIGDETFIKYQPSGDVPVYAPGVSYDLTALVKAGRDYIATIDLRAVTGVPGMGACRVMINLSQPGTVYPDVVLAEQTYSAMTMVESVTIPFCLPTSMIGKNISLELTTPYNGEIWFTNLRLFERPFTFHVQDFKGVDFSTSNFSVDLFFKTGSMISTSAICGQFGPQPPVATPTPQDVLAGWELRIRGKYELERPSVPELVFGGYPGTVSMYGTLALEPNTWHMLTVSCDRDDDGRTCFYIDGVLVGNPETVIMEQSAQVGTPFRVGHGLAQNEQLSYLRLSKVARSATDAQNCFECPRGWVYSGTATCSVEKADINQGCSAVKVQAAAAGHGIQQVVTGLSTDYNNMLYVYAKLLSGGFEAKLGSTVLYTYDPAEKDTVFKRHLIIFSAPEATGTIKILSSGGASSFIIDSLS